MQSALVMRSMDAQLVFAVCVVVLLGATIPNASLATASQQQTFLCSFVCRCGLRVWDPCKFDADMCSVTVEACPMRCGIARLFLSCALRDLWI